MIIIVTFIAILISSYAIDTSIYYKNAYNDLEKSYKELQDNYIEEKNRNLINQEQAICLFLLFIRPMEYTEEIRDLLDTKLLGNRPSSFINNKRQCSRCKHCKLKKSEDYDPFFLDSDKKIVDNIYYCNLHNFKFKQMLIGNYFYSEHEESSCLDFVVWDNLENNLKWKNEE